MGHAQAQDRRKFGLFFLVISIVLAIVLVAFIGQYRSQAAQFRATQDQIAALRANHATDQALIAQDQTLIGQLGIIVAQQSTVNAGLTDQIKATNDNLQKVIADDAALRRLLAAIKVPAPVPPLILKVPTPIPGPTVTVTVAPKCTKLFGLGC